MKIWRTFRKEMKDLKRKKNLKSKNNNGNLLNSSIISENGELERNYIIL